MAADATKCSHCGEILRPLLSSSYCPNDCDRRGAFDNWDNERTHDSPICPECSSRDTEPFLPDPMTSYKFAWHCLPHGHVW